MTPAAFTHAISTPVVEAVDSSTVNPWLAFGLLWILGWCTALAQLYRRGIVSTV